MQLSSPSMVTEAAPSRRRKDQSTLFQRGGAVSASPSPPEARDLDKLVLNLHRQAEIRGPPLHPRPERPSAAKGTNGLADGKNWISSRLLVAPLNCAEGRESSRETAKMPVLPAGQPALCRPLVGRVRFLVGPRNYLPSGQLHSFHPTACPYSLPGSKARATCSTECASEMDGLRQRTGTVVRGGGTRVARHTGDDSGDGLPV